MSFRALSSLLAALLAAPLAALFVLAGPRLARADTYVDEPAFGHSQMGFDVFAATPTARTSAGEDASVVAGGGSELLLGYGWEGGFSLFGVFGYARWSANGNVGDALGDRRASLTHGYAGLAARFALLPEARLSPFVEATLVGGLLRVRGSADGDAEGGGVGAGVGVRYRDAPWDGFVALDLRQDRFGAPTDGGDPIVIARASLTFGALVDLR